MIVIERLKPFRNCLEICFEMHRSLHTTVHLHEMCNTGQRGRVFPSPKRSEIERRPREGSNSRLMGILSVDYKRQAITDLPSFTAEMESQQISQQSREQKVVAFAK